MPRERGGLIIGCQLSLLGIGFEKMEERTLAVADVVERLAESEMEIGPLAAERESGAPAAPAWPPDAGRPASCAWR